MNTSRKVLGIVQRTHRSHPLLELYIATTSTISVVLLAVYGFQGVR